MLLIEEKAATRAGLVAILNCPEIDVQSIVGVEEATECHPSDVALLSIEATRELPRISEATAFSPNLKLVAILSESTPKNVHDALNFGVTSVITWDFHPTDMRKAIQLTANGYSCIPQESMELLSSLAPGARTADALSDHESKWLKTMAMGKPISYIATQENFSEREMFRRLSVMYRKMGVRNRFQAVARAAQWGVLPYKEIFAADTPAGHR
ncbi:helix-turn-helix domain-containing protein [Nocardiopsis kunsanensis]|uniref:LuxR C-terminal-related transcriptional regulator n=1 Tax=Nocardiopsis kunsanensis TaxID=141693 RepID=UPI001874A0EF|nr:LuxR C-terminal-related transcriptional regulator [Nocardiopsis kunsanensis]